MACTSRCSTRQRLARAELDLCGAAADNALRDAGGVPHHGVDPRLVSLGSRLIVAPLVYDVPVGQSLDMGLEGAAFGLFPIMWIVINAVWIYNMTVGTGHFAVLRRSFATISDDQRIQAVIIASRFGALIEGLAGFGTPVAITTVMLIPIGFSPLEAADALADRQHRAGGVRLDRDADRHARRAPSCRSRSSARWSAPDAVPGPDPAADPRRRLRRAARGAPTWPAAMVAGVSFALAQFVCSNYIGRPDRPCLVADLDLRARRLPARLVALGAAARRGQTGGRARDRRRRDRATRRSSASVRLRDQEHGHARARVGGLAPYIIIVAVFAIAKLVDPVEQFLFETGGGTGFGTDEKTPNGLAWPGLDVVTPRASRPRPRPSRSPSGTPRARSFCSAGC